MEPLLVGARPSWSHADGDADSRGRPDETDGTDRAARPRGTDRTLVPVYSATKGDILSGAPVVVLVDAGSASASEVLAGALKDHKRARIVGSRTFGKGSVQSVLPLDNGDAVKLTTARYYTPAGKSIQGVGIKPDVLLRADGKQAEWAGEYRESALRGHLRGDEEDAMAGETGGEVLDGGKPLDAAVLELKKLAGIAVPAAPRAEAKPPARKAKAQ